MISVFELGYQYRNMILIGFKVTVLISIIAIVFGLIVGTGVCFMRLSKSRLLNIIARIYTEVIRGTPVLLQVAMWYYGLPLLGINFPAINMGGFTFDRFICGIIALVINDSAYVSEIVRSGIQSIDKGQQEAALSLGLTKFQTMRLVVLPQAVKNILPALGNDFVTLIKTSSQVSIIGLADLMYTANVIRGNSFRPFAPLLIVAVIYFVLTFGTSCLVRKLETRLNRSSAD